MIKTTDHDEIKAWAERHGGNPQLIDYPEAKADTPGIRINFPGTLDDILLSDSHPPKDISWEEFFKIFENEKLSFEYDKETDSQEAAVLVNAYRFVDRNPIEV